MNRGIMTQSTTVKLFQDKNIRALWDEEREKWYFSVVDVVGVLSESDNPRKYWSVLKTRLKAEGSQLATNCSQLKTQTNRRVNAKEKDLWMAYSHCRIRRSM